MLLSEYANTELSKYLQKSLFYQKRKIKKWLRSVIRGKITSSNLIFKIRKTMHSETALFTNILKAESFIIHTEAGRPLKQEGLSEWDFSSFLNIYNIEAVARRCSVKILLNSQENTCARVSFLIKLQLFTFKICYSTEKWEEPIDCQAIDIKVVESRYIELFGVSPSIKKLFSIARVNIYFSQLIVFANIYLFSIFYFQ